MDFANLFSVILLLVAAGLTVLAGLPVLRKWQRERDSGGWSADAVQGPAEDTAPGYGAEVAMEEQRRPSQPDPPRLVNHHQANDDQDEQMRNRPADEQHHRPSHIAGAARPRQAEEPDPRQAPDVPINGHTYGGFGDVDGDVPANDTNGRYGTADEPDDARRAAHFDWKVAAQYERARAARNASMSSFEPPPLPEDGPGTFTEEIPAIHAADGQRRHPAVHSDPDGPTREPYGQRHGHTAEPPPEAGFEDPWGPDDAAHAPPAFEFDQQQPPYEPYEPYEQRGPEPPAYDQGRAPYEEFAPEQAEADDLAPPPHMRWRPDPEPDLGPMEEPVYGGRAGPPSPRQAFSATTFRVQPAEEEPVSVHVAEPIPAADPPGGYQAAGQVGDPAVGYAGGVRDEQQVDGWAGEETAAYPAVDQEHGYADRYAPAGPATGYDARHYQGPAVFERPAEAVAEAPAAPFFHASPVGDTPARAMASRQPLPDLSPLLAEDEVAELRRRWNEIKGTFPDDPVSSVHEASKLVGECTKLFERRLGVDPDSTDVSTEDLRLALQRYLAFFERLFSS